MLPDVPVMVTAADPVAAADVAVSVSVLVVDVLVGLNDAVTPVGRPDADRVTAPLNPPLGVTVIVLVLLPPCGTLIGPAAARVNPVLTGPARLTARTTTSRVLGNVTLCTVLLVLSGNEYP